MNAEKRTKAVENRKSKHILFVDDEKDWGIRVFEVARMLHFNITIISNPKDVMMMMGKGDFDLLITDIRMPEEDGFKLIRKVRRKFKKLPIIVITKYDTDILHKFFKALNVQKLFIKPFRISEFEDAIRELLSIT